MEQPEAEGTAAAASAAAADTAAVDKACQAGGNRTAADRPSAVDSQAAEHTDSADTLAAAHTAVEEALVQVAEAAPLEEPVQQEQPVLAVQLLAV